MQQLQTLKELLQNHFQHSCAFITSSQSEFRVCIFYCNKTIDTKSVFVAREKRPPYMYFIMLLVTAENIFLTEMAYDFLGFTRYCVNNTVSVSVEKIGIYKPVLRLF